MKKLIYCAAALAAMIFAGSCQRENLEPVAQENTVTYTVELPGVETKAIADGSNVDKLVYEVWKINEEGRTDVTTDLTTVGTRLFQKTIDMRQDAGETSRAIVTLNLVQDQEYTILFWAHNSKAVNNAPAYNTADLTAVTYAADILSGKKTPANNESLAAFFAVDFVSEGDPRSKTVYLKRPFAQLNIGTLNTVAREEYTINMKESKVKVSSVPTVFNVATSVASENVEDFVFDTAILPNNPEHAEYATDAILPVGGVNYQYVAMNYIFANHLTDNGQSPAAVNVEFDINVELDPTADGAANTDATVNHVVPNVPLSQNYRTNIVGNLLTSETEYEVIVDADFENPDYVSGQEWIHTGNYTYTINEGASAAALKELLTHADAAAKAEATKAEGPVVTIDLAGDVVWETGAEHGSTPLIPEGSPISAVVINGNGKTFTATGAGVGPIRLANGGKLTLNNLTIVDESKSYAENSWEFGYLEMAGVLEINDCNVVNAIMFEGETAVFAGCTFNSNKDNEYAVWVSDGIATFNGCTFEGARGLKVHEAYGSEVATVVVDGCTFNQLTKKPGIALGDLNAETSVSIINSTFDRCQAGDQENYMYETDTDVTTFEFTVENNTVIPSGDGVIDQGNGTAAVATTESLAEAIKEGFTTVMLAEGVYVIPNEAKGKTLTFIGTGNPEDTKIATDNVTGSYEGCNYALDGSTVVFENISINTPSSTYIGYARCNGTYNNCIINGTYTLYGNSVFNDCTFNVSGDVYNIWTWGAPTATFNNCTFNSDGKALLLYGQVNTVLTVNECTFNDKGGLTDLKAAIEIGNDYNKSYTLVVNNTTVNGYEINDKGTVTGTTVWANKNSMTTENLSVTIDDLTWVGGSLYKDADGNLIVGTVDALTLAAAYATESETYVIITKDLEGDATLVQKPGVKLVINGQDKNYKGVITVDGKSATYTTAGLTIKNLTFNAEAISADACIRLGDGTNATRYTCNVTVDNCTFDVPGAVGVKSYTGGDKNLVITGCTATANAHSLLQAKGIDGISVEGCTINSKNGLNFNNSIDVIVNQCNANVKGYAARFGEGSADERAETYKITNSTLKSACEDGDAVIILRGSAANATLNIENTTLEGTALIANNAQNAKVYMDGKVYIANGLYAAGNTYTVYSGDGFKYAATNILSDASKNVTIELANDIDLAGIQWPAVKTAAAFVLDGKGYSIKNLTTSAVEDHGFYSTAMFTSTRKATTIKNLVVEDATITGKGGDNSHGAVLVACNYAALNIEGVTVKNSTVSNCDRSSALVTYLYFTTATVKDCIVEGCEVNSIGTAGALLGMNNSHDFEATGNTVKNTTISSSEGSNKAGILIGTWQKAGTLTEIGNVVENSKAINAGVETNNNIGREV